MSRRRSDDVEFAAVIDVADSLLQKRWRCLFHIYVMPDSEFAQILSRILTETESV